MTFAGGAIDCMVVCGPTVLRTSRRDGTLAFAAGIGQVRRALACPDLEVLHVVFAPLERRPLLLGIARIRNPSDALRRVRYTELWQMEGAGIDDPAGGQERAGEGVAIRGTSRGAYALADAAVAIRGRAAGPTPTSEGGLSLDFDLVIPPEATRELHLAYVAPGPDESPGPLVQAWRGAVPEALSRMVAAWTDRLGEASVAAYRGAVREGVGEPAS